MSIIEVNLMAKGSQKSLEKQEKIILALVFFLITLSLAVNIIFGQQSLSDWLYSLLNKIIEALIIGLIMSIVAKFPSQLMR